MITRDEALALDSADPLAHFRDRFHIPQPHVVYLDGNSLGMPPKRTIERITEIYEGTTEIQKLVIARSVLDAR